MAEAEQRGTIEDSVLNWQRRRDDDARRAESVINGIILKLKNKNGEWIEHPNFSAELIARKIEEDRDPLRSYVTAVKRVMNSVDVHGASGDVVQVPLEQPRLSGPV